MSAMVLDLMGPSSRGPQSWNEPANLLLLPAASRFLRDPDLLGEHADVQWAGWFVLVNVLTVGLVTLNEMSSGPSEAVRSTETDQHPFGYYLAPELPPAISAHMISYAETAAPDTAPTSDAPSISMNTMA